MNITFYTFAKKRNSTAIPTDTGTTINCELKDDTSFIHPTIILKPDALTSGTFSPSLFNYCRILYWQRFYYISDWQYLRGVWQAVLTVDALASFRGAIGNLSAYVVRSAFESDGTISDVIYPTTSGVTFNREFFSMNLSTTGCYVVGIISNSSNANSDGAVSYYVMAHQEIANLKSYLMSDSFLSANGLASNPDLSASLIKAICNPFQYIVSCRFFPIDYATVTNGMTAVTSINVGWWSIPMTGYILPSGYAATVYSNTVPCGNHPQAATRGVYLNHAPYTERILIHPMIGTVLLDSNKINSGDSITVFTRVDFTTGESVTYIDNSTRQITLYATTGMFAIEVQIASMNINYIQGAKTAVNSVGSIVNGAATGFAAGGVAGAITGAIAGGASGILNTLEAALPVMQSAGTNGNRSIYHIPVYLYSFYRHIVDEDNTDKGRPLCKVRTLKNVPGYILCMDAHANINCTDTEKAEIETYLNTGFFYE